MRYSTSSFSHHGAVHVDCCRVFICNTAAAALLIMITASFPGACMVHAAEMQAGSMPAGAWQDAGPGPILSGQVEHVARAPGSDEYENEVVGAVARIAPHPTDPNIMYITTVNGGVWKTTNAQGTPPTWTPLTDHVTKSLSMVAIALDHYNPDTVVAGFGRYSSYAFIGGDELGILRSDNAGASWRLIDDPLVANTRVSQLVIHGDVIMACTFGGANPGIIRSKDGGNTWTRNADLNFMACLDMAFRIPQDPEKPLEYGYAWLDGANNPDMPPGLYRTTDGGITWVEYVAGKPQPPVIEVPGNESFRFQNAKVRVHPVTGRVVAACVLNEDPLNANLAYSDDNGKPGTWASLPKPQTVEEGGPSGTNPVFVGLKAENKEDEGGSEEEGEGEEEDGVPGTQAFLHFSLGLHPANDSFVFVGGDRQSLDPGYNSVNASDYTGRLFVCVIVGSPGESFCVPFTHGSDTSPGTTAHFSSPHADSRDLQADAAGNVIEADDGGIYRRTNPLAIERAAGGLGDWYSMIGNLKITEAHDVAYDPLLDVFMTGNQDNGLVRQHLPGEPAALSIANGDGGDIAIGVLSENSSISYASLMSLLYFSTLEWGLSNSHIAWSFRSLAGAEAEQGSADYFPPKATIAINRFDLSRVVIHGTKQVYEATEFGDMATGITSDYYCPGSLQVSGVVFGGSKDGDDFPDLLYVACASLELVVRSPLLSGDATAVHRYTLTSLPADQQDSMFTSLTVDPEDMDVAFATVAPGSVIMMTGLATTDLEEDTDLTKVTAAGFTFRDLSGNIAEKSSYLQTIVFVRGSTDGYLLVGGRSGVFITGPMSDESFGVIWRDFEPLPSARLPNVYVYELTYSAEKDVLLAATMGRGVQRMDGASLAVDPPRLVCPDVKVITKEGRGAPAVYSNLLAQGVGELTCTPANETVFSPGFTNVSCEARNQVYGTAQCSFKVFVGDSEPVGGSSDPHFVAGNGLKFDFMGAPDATYCLISDELLHVNMRMVGAANAPVPHLPSSTSPTLATAPARTATWIRSLSIMFWPYYNVTIDAASPEGTPFTAAHGTVTVNNKQMRSKADKKHATMARWHGLTVTRRKTRVNVEISGLLSLEVEVVRASFWKTEGGPGSNFLNFKIRKMSVTEGVHGLLGQTFRGDFNVTQLANKSKNGEGVIEGKPRDYETTDLLDAAGCAKFTRFFGATRGWRQDAKQAGGNLHASQPLRAWEGNAGGDSMDDTDGPMAGF